MFSPSSAFTQVLWKKLPEPFGVDSITALPPVAKVCWAEAQISSISLTKAASSITNSDSASDLPASGELDMALICEPFAYLKDNLLSSTESVLSQLGK